MADITEPPADVLDPNCVAHGNNSCWQCSLNPSTCAQPGETPGCGEYAVTGMHWDSCPNRVQKVYAGRMELTTGKPYGPISEATHHNLLEANRQLREELRKAQAQMAPDWAQLTLDRSALEMERRTVMYLSKVIARLGEQLELVRWLHAKAEFKLSESEFLRSELKAFADDIRNCYTDLQHRHHRTQDLVDELRKQLAAFVDGPACRDRTHLGLSAGETERLRNLETVLLEHDRGKPSGQNMVDWLRRRLRLAELAENHSCEERCTKGHHEELVSRLFEVAREGGWTPGLDVVDWFRKRLVEWSALRGVVSDIGADAPDICDHHGVHPHNGLVCALCEECGPDRHNAAHDYSHLIKPAGPVWTAGMVIEHHNTTGAKYQAKLLQPVPYNDSDRTWWSSKVTKIVTSPDNMPGVSIGQHINLAPGKNNRVVQPEEPAGEYCDTCKDTFPKNDHYHCVVCSGRTGMMGHPDGCPNSWAVGDLIEYTGVHGGWWVSQLISQLGKPSIWKGEVVASTIECDPVGAEQELNERALRNQRVAHGVDARPRPTRAEWMAHYEDRYEASRDHAASTTEADIWARNETTRVLGEEPPE